MSLYRILLRKVVEGSVVVNAHNEESARKMGEEIKDITADWPQDASVEVVGVEPE